MPTISHQLLSRILRTGCLSEAIEYGISAEDFPIAEERAIFKTLITAYGNPNTAGSVIGNVTAREVFPFFYPAEDVNMSTQALCVGTRTERLKHLVESQLPELQSLACVDPLEAANRMSAVASHILALGSANNTDVPFGASLGRIVNRYEQQLRGVTFAKTLWPWQIMNDHAGGIEDEDYIVIYGRPKSKKTFVLTKMIAHQYELGKRILVYTKEMTPDNMNKRITAFLGGFPYNELRNAHLCMDHYHLLHQLMMSAQSDDRMTCLSGQDVGEGQDTMSWLRSKIERYKPDICFIDGLYLMSSNVSSKAADWQRIMQISRQCRAMVLSTKVPVVATVQANRKAAGHSNAELDEIAYADAIGQDATCAIRCIAEKAEIDPDTGEKLDPTVALAIAGSREYSLDGFRIFSKCCENFDFHSQLTSKDIEKAKTEESDSDGDSEGKGKKSGKKGTKQNKNVESKRSPVEEERLAEV